MKLQIRVEEIKGTCPVHEIGDTFELADGYKLRQPDGKQVCMHALSALMPFYNAFAKGIQPEEIGLAGEEPGSLYFQCMDPFQITGGGTVIFRVKKIA